MRVLGTLLLALPLAMASSPSLARETLWEGEVAAGGVLVETFTLARSYDGVDVDVGGATVVVRGPDGLVRYPSPYPLLDATWRAGDYEIVATRAGGTDLPPADLRVSGIDAAALEAARVTILHLDVAAQTSASYIEDPFNPLPGGYVVRTIDCRGGAATVVAWDGDHPLPFTLPMSGAGFCVDEERDLALGYLSVPIEIDYDAVRIIIDAYGPPGFVAHYTIRAVPS